MASSRTTEAPLAGADYLRLDRQLCFATYRASRAFTAAYRPALDELGLTYPQYLVMLALWDDAEQGGSGLAVRRLGDQLDLDSGTLSPLLKRMQAAGLLRRERSAEDERVVEISLTPSGRRLRRQARRVPREIAAAAGITAQEYDQLRTVLGRLTASLRDSTDSDNH